MAVLRSLLYALIFYAGTVLYVLGAFPVALFGRRPLRRYVRGWVLFHRWCAHRLLGIAPRVEGTISRDAALFAAKHESMYETIALVAMLDDPAIVMKRELTEIPLWGWLARCYGVIAVDRAAGGAALRKMILEAKAQRMEGRPILIFPEGTRVAPGKSVPLRPGFTGLYRALGLPVAAIAVDSGRLWPRGFVKRPGTITFRFAPPIPPGLPRDEIEQRVHAAINLLSR